MTVFSTSIKSTIFLVKRLKNQYKLFYFKLFLAYDIISHQNQMILIRVQCFNIVPCFSSSIEAGSPFPQHIFASYTIYSYPNLLHPPSCKSLLYFNFIRFFSILSIHLCFGLASGLFPFYYRFH